MNRRQRDKAQRRAAANERIGHENAYAIVYGKWWGAGIAVVGLALGATWVDKNIDPLALARGTAFTLLTGAAIILIPYGVWLVSLITRRQRNPYLPLSVPWWPHLTAVAGGLLVVAGILVFP